MIKPAFSTVACPDWVLEKVAASGADAGFEAVELRTFGESSTRSACDPALTAEPKVRSLMDDTGLEILSLATSVRFDEPIRPPVIGLAIGDTERSVRAANRAVDMAVALECPFVRVFGFELPPREKPTSATARILKRLAAVLDHAHDTGVRLTLENGGSFPTARHVADVIRQAGSPLLGACYALAAASAAGEVPARGLDALGDRLWSARLKDWKDHRPCRLGEGTLPCREFVGALTKSGFSGPLIFEWDRQWIPSLSPPEQVLPDAAQTLSRWIGEAGGGGGAPGPSQQPRLRGVPA